ncbi:unnamed protein product [Allacma fusca]|uniref:Uncharacterized protein n=1 Tax=Allacma fusca TaxID=39272 RepID=A0A8J2K2B0_9HEXA|nr:unnamed protein product [Allacma fusca]
MKHRQKWLEWRKTLNFLQVCREAQIDPATKGFPITTKVQGNARTTSPAPEMPPSPEQTVEIATSEAFIARRYQPTLSETDDYNETGDDEQNTDSVSAHSANTDVVDNHQLSLADFANSPQYETIIIDGDNEEHNQANTSIQTPPHTPNMAAQAGGGGGGRGGPILRIGYNVFSTLLILGLITSAIGHQHVKKQLQDKEMQREPNPYPWSPQRPWWAKIDEISPASAEGYDYTHPSFTITEHNDEIGHYDLYDLSDFPPTCNSAPRYQAFGSDTARRLWKNSIVKGVAGVVGICATGIAVMGVYVSSFLKAIRSPGTPPPTVKVPQDWVLIQAQLQDQRPIWMIMPVNASEEKEMEEFLRDPGMTTTALPGAITPRNAHYLNETSPAKLWNQAVKKEMTSERERRHAPEPTYDEMFAAVDFENLEPALTPMLEVAVVNPEADKENEQVADPCNGIIGAMQAGIPEPPPLSTTTEQDDTCNNTNCRFRVNSENNDHLDSPPSSSGGSNPHVAQRFRKDCDSAYPCAWYDPCDACLSQDLQEDSPR